MKRLLVSAILSAVMVITVAMPNAQAAPITTHMDEVSVIATNPGGTLDLTAYNIDLLNLNNIDAPEAVLEYSTGGNFQAVTNNSITINDDWSQIFFRLVLPAVGTVISGGNLTFSGSDSAGQEYTNALIGWDFGGYRFSLLAGENGTLLHNSSVSNVPIPAPALLLCTGLIGMIIYRRRTTMPV